MFETSAATEKGAEDLSRRVALTALAMLIVAQIVANSIVLKYQSDDINYAQRYHEIIFNILAAELYPPDYPSSPINWFLFYPLYGSVLRISGFSLYYLKLFTTLFWAAGLMALYLAGSLILNRNAGLIAALLFSAMALPNNFSRSYDVHIPRMVGESLVLAGCVYLSREKLFNSLILIVLGITIGINSALLMSDPTLFLIAVFWPLLWALIKVYRRFFLLKKWLTLSLLSAVLAAVSLFFLAAVHGLNLDPRLSALYDFYGYFNTFIARYLPIDYLLRESTNTTAQFASKPVLYFFHFIAFPLAILLYGINFPLILPSLTGVVSYFRNGLHGASLLLPSLLIPQFLFTLVLKKNFNYFMVILPYAALLCAVGLSQLKIGKIRLYAVVIIFVLLGNGYAWMRQPFNIHVHNFYGIFQWPDLELVTTKNNLTDGSINHYPELNRLLQDVCDINDDCRILSIFSIPLMGYHYLDLVKRYPRALWLTLDQPLSDTLIFNFNKGIDVAIFDTGSFFTVDHSPFDFSPEYLKDPTYAFDLVLRNFNLDMKNGQKHYYAALREKTVDLIFFKKIENGYIYLNPGSNRAPAVK